jgi:hypothetical protein
MSEAPLRQAMAPSLSHTHALSVGFRVQGWLTGIQATFSLSLCGVCHLPRMAPSGYGSVRLQGYLAHKTNAIS